MRVLVDTCIWSQALRHSNSKQIDLVQELIEVIKEHRAQIIGPIRQELLSGIRGNEQFKKLQKYLTAFPDIPLISTDYESAAEFYNICRAKGVQGSNTDFLICAVACRCGISIFTYDADFIMFSKYLPIRLHNLR